MNWKIIGLIATGVTGYALGGIITVIVEPELINGLATYCALGIFGVWIRAMAADYS